MQPFEAVDATSPATLTRAAAPDLLPFRFSGRADEYFRIWIVNLALTIVTLGVYSAWAKVRSERYFYGNTTVGGTPFEYLADPIAILKGRAIAAILLLAYVGTAQVSPVLNLVVLLILLVLFPWMLTRSLAFRARYSAWRSIRFGFDGGYGQAFKLYILLPIASIFTLYLAFPWVVRQQTEWLASQHRYGGTRLTFSAETSQFYAIYLLATASLIGIALLVALVGALASAFLADGGGDALRLGLMLTVAGIYLAGFAVGVYIRAASANIMWNGIEVAGCRFQSTISGREMALLFITNAIAILCTLGLAYPWARIRVARYRAEHLAFLPSGNPDQFFADAASSAPAFGSEAADLFDVDISW